MSHNGEVVHPQLLHVHAPLANHLCRVRVHQDPGQPLGRSPLIKGTDALAQLCNRLAGGKRLCVPRTVCSPLSSTFLRGCPHPVPLAPLRLTMMTPVSLLASMMETRQVVGRMAARTSSTSARPLRGDTGTKVASASQGTSPDVSWKAQQRQGLPMTH